MAEYDKERYMEKFLADAHFEKETEIAKAEDGMVIFYFIYR